MGTKLGEENSVPGSYGPLSVAEYVVREAQSRLKPPLVREVPAVVAEPARLGAREHCGGDTAAGNIKRGLFVDEHGRGSSVLVYHRRGVFPAEAEIYS